ncbi:MAG: hypothetical protein ACI4JG_04145 [Acutalibacteraceae bacterium]
MKFIKKSTALLLCFAVLLSTSLVCAYAESPEDDSQYADINPEDLGYVGTVFEDKKNEVDWADFPGCQYYVAEFTASESGYYRFSDKDTIVAYQKSDSETRFKKVEGESFYCDGYYFVHLESGLYHVLFNNYLLLIKSLGELEKITYEKSAFRKAINGLDFCAVSKSGEVTNALYYTFPTAVFEKESVLMGDFINLTCDQDIVSGENEVSFVLLGQEFTETLELIEINDMIDSIDIGDIKSWYDGLALPEYITVNFSDGTCATENCYEDFWEGKNSVSSFMKFPNGRYYDVVACFSYENDNNKYENCKLNIKIRSNYFRSKICFSDESFEVKPTGIKENIDRFFKNASTIFYQDGFLTGLFYMRMDFVLLLMYFMDLSLGNV